MRKSWALCLPLLALGSDPASAINTIKDWDGQQAVSDFGCPDTQTVGQVITVRKTAKHLNKFTFELANFHIPEPNVSMVVRAEVYAWDGSKASGAALFESEPRAISYAYDDFSFHKEIFRTSMLTLLPGRYILFVSVAKDLQQCFYDYELKEGAVHDSSYRGGTFYYQNDNMLGPSAWTTLPWDTLRARYDLAFKADLTP